MSQCVGVTGYIWLLHFNDGNCSLGMFFFSHRAPWPNKQPFRYKVTFLTSTVPLHPREWFCVSWRPQLVINWAKTSNAWLWLACLIMDMKQNWYTLMYQHYYSDHICTGERSHISLLHQCASIQYICVLQRQRDPSALCFALVKGRDEMRLNRDGDITSWQAAPGRPWCLDHRHTLIQ